MLVSAAEFTNTGPSAPDVCIIGGGAAGLVLAHELSRGGRTVVVLESGDNQPDPQCDALISGVSSGFSIDGQRRRLGGGLNDWGANCAVLDRADFSETVVPDLLSWPFGPDELDRRRERAAAYLGVTSDKRSLAETGMEFHEEWETTGQRLAVKPFLKGDQHLAGTLRDDLARADHRALVVTRATVLGFDLGEGDTQITAVRYVMPDGNRARLAAGTFVLAAGIENAPVLMRGLCRDPALTLDRWPAMGRRLHAHLLSLHGLFRPNAGVSVPDRFCLTGDLGARAPDGRGHYFGLRANTPDQPNSIAWLVPLDRKSQLVPGSFVRNVRRSASIWTRLRPGAAVRGQFAIRHFMEQPARPDARVTLGAPSGPLGLAEPVWDWHVGTEETRAMEAVCSDLDANFAKAGLGRVVSNGSPGDAMAPHITLNAHPMGGTIAGADRSNSVVDANLKVHGLQNLYVCGGSVIPRGGTAMVTTVITQLALRLADHLSGMRP